MEIEWDARHWVCLKPPDASAWDITLHGREGCWPCRLDPRNYDELVLDVQMDDVQPGEGMCRRCRMIVTLKIQPNGLTHVLNPNGSVHVHLGWDLPVGQEARTERRIPVVRGLDD